MESFIFYVLSKDLIKSLLQISDNTKTKYMKRIQKHLKRAFQKVKLKKLFFLCMFLVI